MSDREYNTNNSEEIPFQEVKLHKKSINTSTKLIVIMLQISQ